MLSETLTEGLQRYRIGAKIRELRLKKKLGLVQLGDHTGLSPAMLSKIERGRLFPTLPTLLRIALVFGVGLDHFFTEADARPRLAVTRRKDRIRLPDRQGRASPAYYFESLDYPAPDRKLASYLAEFPVHAATSEAHAHEGAELVYVVDGRLEVEVDGEIIGLEEGDSLYFESSAPHTYRQEGESACRAVIVATP
jgi:transcriptional regulator with XRE-family HTH domain